MNRKKPGSVFSSKAFYIAFSILVSIALWMFVEINENQVIVKEVNGVVVVRKNEELLNDRSLSIASMDPETVTLTFECTRSVAQKLNRDTLSVEIDLSSITSRGSPYLPYEIIYPADVDVSAIERVGMSVEQISLRIDRLQTSPIQVEVLYGGGVAEGYYMDPLYFSPQNISVSGSADAVSQVWKAQVNITERENLTQTLEGNFRLTLLDANGAELSEALRNQLTVSDQTVHVTIPIKMTKEVPLEVVLNHGAGSSVENTTVTINPQTVMIAGDPEYVREINSIVLGTIDMTSFGLSINNDMPIIIPQHVFSITEDRVARVSIQVSGLEVSYLTTSNIHIANEPKEYVVDIISRGVDVRVRGRPEDLAYLTEDSVRVVATVPENFTLAQQRLNARVFIDGIDRDIGAVGVYYVNVNIREISSIIEPEEPEESEEP